MSVFPAYQILEMAVRIEEIGVEFYKKLADLADEPETKKLFLDFLEQEIEHKKLFTDMAQSFKEGESAETYPMEAYRYVETAVSTIESLAFDFKDAAVKPFNIGKAVNIAINIETEAIDVYSKIYSTIGEHSQGVLTGIIAEEKKHLETFAKLKSEIISQGKAD